MGKTHSNRALYITILRSMTPEERLRKAFELTEMARALTRAGIARQRPELTVEEVDRLVRDRVIAWHSKIS
jgi:hypothetical protein